MIPRLLNVLGFARMVLALVTVCLLPASVVVAEDDPSNLFQKGNQLYAQAKFQEAVAVYQKAVESGHVSSALYFNLGNAWLKCGQTGHAIACYRWALELAPRDTDIRVNLQFARNRGNPSKAAHDAWWQRAVRWLTLNEWGLLTSVLWWTTLTLWAMQWLFPRQRSTLLRCIKVVMPVLVLFMAGLGLRILDHHRKPIAIIVAKEATVRYGPLEEAKLYYQLADGAEVTALDQQDNWLQIVDASNRQGWIKRDQAVLVIPGQAGVPPKGLIP